MADLDYYRSGPISDFEDPAYKNMWGLSGFDGGLEGFPSSLIQRVVDAATPLYSKLPWAPKPPTEAWVKKQLMITVGVVGVTGTIWYVRRRHRRLQSTAQAIAMADLGAWQKFRGLRKPRRRRRRA